MKKTFQERLISIPLDQLTFIVPLPKKLIYYEQVLLSIPSVWSVQPALLFIKEDGDIAKLNSMDTASRLIQDPNLTAIVLCTDDEVIFREEILALFRECTLPIIQIRDGTLLGLFLQTSAPFHLYGQISTELYQFIDKGFIQIAEHLAAAFETPLLYLDENSQLLWQSGKENELRKARTWVNARQKQLAKNEPVNAADNDPGEPYDIYCIHAANLARQKLIASANLADWQKQMLDKLTGLTALMLQLEGMFQEQQQQFQEHFIYDLLYHKFESHKMMIKQGKTWGWNLEKPHHLLLIDPKISGSPADSNWMDEILTRLETYVSGKKEQFIIFPFEDQIVVLLEDGEKRTIHERKKFVLKAAADLEKELASQWRSFQFKIGIGKWYRETAFLNKSYQEAKLALRFGEIWLEDKNIYHIKELGGLRLLLHVHEEILSDYYREYLAQLIESDKNNGTEYIKTLKAYFRHHGLINEVAESLFVHPNTLRNRIKRIEEITGTDLQNSQEFMNLNIAIKVHSLLSQ